MSFEFHQVDVFTHEPLFGNPLAVVVGADSLTDDQMARFANWTNLSETTFLLKPQSPLADYRVRIFTPTEELPFAGHPTLGTCSVWLTIGGQPKADHIVQECGVGLIPIRRREDRLYFAAPPLRRSGKVEEAYLKTIRAALGLTTSQIIDANWTDNGPPWISVLLKDAQTVLNVKPNFPALEGLDVGIVGRHSDADKQNGLADFEVRGFMTIGAEDPVTGSLNAGIAQWLIGASIAPDTYLATQGTALGRRGRIYVEKADGQIWIGGDVIHCISGNLNIS